MPETEHILFDCLKKEIADMYRKTYPSCLAPIEEWKGQDIANFQEELIIKVKGRISEKWFYTHIKTKGDKLPRIDMLNMLSEYVGYQSWRDFTSKKQDFTKEKEEHIPEPIIIPAEKEVKEDNRSPIIEELSKIEQKNTTPDKPKKTKLWFYVAGGILVLILFLIFKDSRKTYRCCFTDLNGRPLVANANVEVRLLKQNESPALIECDKNGCIDIKTSEKQIQFMVSSPYYKPETITRLIDEPVKEEQVRLETNDYALMIHYFSTAKIKDWKQRRMQLEDMISRDAKIFQVYENGSGMELYNREEFINKLTMPLKSLKNIEIIETRYSENQISLLRFVQLQAKK